MSAQPPNVKPEAATERGRTIELTGADTARYGKTLDLAFPKSALAKGTLGELAELLSKGSEVSPEMVFGSGLACVGSMITGKLRTTKSDSDVRLYTVLLGQSYSSKKSSAFKKTVRFFRESVHSAHPLNVCDGVGSAEGLARQLQKTPNLLLCQDELETFFKKSAIEGSILLQAVTSLFEKTSFQSATRNEDLNIPDARLSFLAACTFQTYEHCWSPGALAIGFDNRLFLVNGSLRAPVGWEKSPAEKELHDLAVRFQMQFAKLGGTHPLVLEATPGAYSRYEDWYRAEVYDVDSPYVKRIDTIAARLLPLLAFTQDETVIDVEVVDQVVEIMRHQVNLRRCYSPIDAENQFARMEESIKRQLAAKGPLTNEELMRCTNAWRVGTWIFAQARDGLMKQAVIEKWLTDGKWRLKPGPTSIPTSGVPGVT